MPRKVLRLIIVLAHWFDGKYPYSVLQPRCHFDDLPLLCIDVTDGQCLRFGSIHTPQPRDILFGQVSTCTDIPQIKEGYAKGQLQLLARRQSEGTELQ